LLAGKALVRRVKCKFEMTIPFKTAFCHRAGGNHESSLKQNCHITPG
jgi:hypothetical protein